MELLAPLIINIFIMVGIAALIVKLVRSHNQNNHKSIDQIIQKNNQNIQEQINQIIQKNTEMQAELKNLTQQIEEILKK